MLFAEPELGADVAQQIRECQCWTRPIFTDQKGRLIPDIFLSSKPVYSERGWPRKGKGTER
jgi:hypothetical protein